MTGSTHEAGFEWDYTHGQTPAPRHQQVGLRQFESTPAETGTAVSLSQRGTVFGIVFGKSGTPTRKAEIPALKKEGHSPSRVEG